MSKIIVEESRKAVKIGNSLGVTIPAEMVERIHLKQGDNLTIQLDEQGNMLLKKEVKQVKGMSLEQLMKFRGIISKERGEEWIKEVEESRNNW